MMAKPALVLLLLGVLCGCQEQMYGSGVVFLFNGTERRVTIVMDGRSPNSIELRPGGEKFLEAVIADDYQVSISMGEGIPWMGATPVVKERLTIVNVDGAGCFARADVAGMYNKKKAPVRVLEVYKGQAVTPIADEIAILPGFGLPEKRPKNAFAFQRVAVVPCDVAGDDWNVEDYLEKRR